METYPLIHDKYTRSHRLTFRDTSEYVFCDQNAKVQDLKEIDILLMFFFYFYIYIFVFL